MTTGEAAGAGFQSARERERNEWALRERVKELDYLYRIAQIVERGGEDLDASLGEIVALLPGACQHPGSAVARVSLDGRDWDAGEPGRATATLAAEVRPGGIVRGRVALGYVADQPQADEGPFLRYERALVEGIARQVTILVEQRESALEKERLRLQLWHSERLGMIGQLAAGLAHELNEPLGSILGYAQLAQKSFGLPDQTGRDLEKVVRASLHAREIVRKLLLFARQTAWTEAPVDLNAVVRETLFLLEGRCRRAGVRIQLRLAPELPAVRGDRSLFEQVFLSLAVNGIQALSEGGRLGVATAAAAGGVELTVEDDGEGMTPDVLRHCFDPFFTTKDVGHGTGMGLAVSHGIVTSAGGRIGATSEPGRGSRFVVWLPAAPAAEDAHGSP